MTKSLWWYRCWIAWSGVFAALALGMITRGASTTFNGTVAVLHGVLLLVNVILLHRQKQSETKQ